MTDTTNVFRVSWEPQRPVVHLHIGPLGLCLPDYVHEHVDGALRRRLSVAVQHRDSKNQAKTLFAGPRILGQHSFLTTKLGLAVQVGRSGSSVVLVRSLAGCAREDVVGRDIDEEDVPRRGEAG